MPIYPAQYSPGVEPDYRGLGASIAGLGGNLAGAYEKHKELLKTDASNQFLASQAIQSGQIPPEALGFPTGATPSPAEMLAKYQGMNRNAQNGIIAGITQNYIGNLLKQQADIREMNLRGNLYGARNRYSSALADQITSAAAAGGGGAGGQVQIQPLIGPDQKPVPGFGVAHLPGTRPGTWRTQIVPLKQSQGVTTVQDPNTKLWHYERDGKPYFLPQQEVEQAQMFDTMKKQPPPTPSWYDQNIVPHLPSFLGGKPAAGSTTEPTTGTLGQATGDQGQFGQPSLLTNPAAFATAPLGGPGAGGTPTVPQPQSAGNGTTPDSGAGSFVVGKRYQDANGVARYFGGQDDQGNPIWSPTPPAQ
jgi:hypothetical protein